jgi:hypothetical protein
MCRFAQTNGPVPRALYPEQRTRLNCFEPQRAQQIRCRKLEIAKGITAAGHGCGEIPARNLNVISGQFNTSNLV